ERPGDLELWRYPFAIAVTAATTDTANRILRRLAERHPALASIVIDESTRQFGGADRQLEGWEASATAIRTAEQVWVDAIGPLAALIAPLDNGRLPPLGTRFDGEHLIAAWYRGTERRPDVFELTAAEWATVANDHHDLGPARSSPPAGGPGWAWHWTRHELRRS